MSRETKIICNLCGKPFDEADRHQHIAIYTQLGYGSKYDGSFLALDICNSCMDSLIDRCAVNPLEEGLWSD